MAKNILSLQLLRNTTAFESYSEATAGITGASTNDGTIKLARYVDGDKIKTIFGIYNEEMASKGSGYTIYDGDSEVISDIIGRLDAIDGGSSSSGTIDQKITSAISALDYTGVTTGDGVVITNVTETDGVVSATAANVGTLKLAGYTEGEASGKVKSTDSLNEALAKLQNQIDAANESTDAAIEALDYTDTAVTGSYVSKVDQTNGLISVTRVALPDLSEVHEVGKPIIAVSETKGQVAASAGTINAEYVNVTGSVFSSTTVQGALEEIESEYKAADAALKTEILGGASESADTLGELETLINNLSSNAATYTVKKVTTGLDTNVKEEYVLVETKNGVPTDKEVAIPIYKDNTLKSVELVDENLVFTYIVDSGETSVPVNVSKFLSETEFGSGVTANSDGYVHGVVDSTSERFLTVGANGFKLSGVQNAIDVAVSSASEELKNTIDTVSGNVNTLSAKTVTVVDMTGGTAALANNADGTKKITINVDGSSVSATSYSKGSDASHIVASDSINAALSKLENQIEKAQSAATTKVVEGTDAGNNLEISSATGSDGSVTYTINLSDVASASALTAEIAARKNVDGVNGDAYTANTNAYYINNAASLFGADQALDSAINTVSGKVDTISGDVETLENRVDAISAVTSALTTGEIDAIENAIGLNGDGTHITSTGHYTSSANTIESEIVALDAQVKTNADNISTLSGNSLTGVTVNGSALTVTNNVAAVTVQGKQSAATSTGNEAIVVETDTNGNLTLGLGNLDAGTY